MSQWTEREKHISIRRASFLRLFNFNSQKMLGLSILSRVPGLINREHAASTYDSNGKNQSFQEIFSSSNQ
jgi:hypothetical protein